MFLHGLWHCSEVCQHQDEQIKAIKNSMANRPDFVADKDLGADDDDEEEEDYEIDL